MSADFFWFVNPYPYCQASADVHVGHAPTTLLVFFKGGEVKVTFISSR